MYNAPERLRINGNVIDDIDGDFTGKPLCLSSGAEYIRADLHDATKAQLAKAVEALRKLHHAVCGETGFAQCVRDDSNTAYPWPALDEADALARAVLAEIEKGAS